jgi:hypothetical protein
MTTIQDREDIGNNRYIVTPLAHIAGYRIDIMMAEYFHSTEPRMSRFLDQADEFWLERKSGKLDYSPYLLHWIRIIDTASGRWYCLNRDEAQAFALFFGLCNGVGNNIWLLADIIALAIRTGSFSELSTSAQDALHAAYIRNEGIQHYPEDWKMANRPEFGLGNARYACIAQPAIRNARADYCVLSRFTDPEFQLDMYHLPSLHAFDSCHTPSDTRYFWLRYIDCGTGKAYCLSNSQADAFILLRHSHCWGRSIHCLFDIGILSEPNWIDDPRQCKVMTCLERGSFHHYISTETDEDRRVI